MSLTQFLDSPSINMDHLHCIDIVDIDELGTVDISPCSINRVLDEDSIPSDGEPLPAKGAPIELEDLVTSSSVSSFTTSTTSETDSSELTDIALLMNGLLLNATDSGIPLPPSNLPLGGFKFANEPVSPLLSTGLELEPEIQVVDDNFPVCSICYVPSPPDTMRTMPCCGDAFCSQCMISHINALYESGRAVIPCLSCNEILSEDIVFGHLGSIDKKKFTYMIVNAANKPTIKACTNCYHIVERTEKDIKKMKKSRGKILSTISRTTCDNCATVFCFYCQAPWHEGLSCKSFQKGDGLFKNWMKKRSGNQANAHRCPNCKVPIQRISGCPNMTCSRCHTNWCYDCGKRKIQTIIFGGHDSKWSIFGCDRYKFHQGPKFTKAVRGSVFITEIGIISAACLLLTPILLALWPGLLIFGVPTLIAAIVYFKKIK